LGLAAKVTNALKVHCFKAWCLKFCNKLTHSHPAGFYKPLFVRIFTTVQNMIMETVLELPVSFTQHAVEEINRLMNMEGFDKTTYLRIGVKGGGCSGLTYVLGFDKKEESDETYEYSGFQFVMNKSHGIYLMGMEIDWQDGLNARGFVFKNPNASKTCGCGTSFSV
jgi:iron-sulfur cluster assembly protein